MEVRHLIDGERKNRRKRFPFRRFEEMEKYMNKIMREALADNNGINSQVYIILIGDNSKLETTVNERESLNKMQNRSKVREQHDALIDVFEDNNKVVVVAEAPNIKKEDVELVKTGDFLTIWLSKPQRRNLKTVELPANVNVKEAKINCKNRVLEVALPKIGKRMEENFRI